MSPDAVAPAVTTRAARGAGALRVGERASLALTSEQAVAFVFVCSLAFALVILAITDGWPINDDGAVVIAERLPLTLTSALLPFHQHLNLIPLLIWDRIAAIFGTGSMRPFMVVLLVTHVALATSMTALLVRRVGPRWAVAIGLPLALLGSASYDFLRPWQILFTIVLLAGVVTISASLDRTRSPRRRAIVIVATIVAVLTSNLALFVILGLALWFVLDGRWRQVGELVPAVALFAVWFVTYGRQGALSDGNPLSIETWAAVVPYTVTGITTAAGLGLGSVVGAFVLGIAAVKVRPSAPLLAFLIAIVAMFAVGALFRSYGATAQAGTSRYILLAAYLAAFGLAAAGPRLPEWRYAIAGGQLVATLNVVVLVTALPIYFAGGYT